MTDAAAAVAVIFDNDGVLVDSEHFSIQAYRKSIEEQGVALREEDNERYCGLTDADIITDMRERYSTDLDLDKFSERKRELYFELAGAGELKPFAGAVELLEELRGAEVPYALASSGSLEKITFNLRQSGLLNYFDVLVTGEDFKRGKPDPEVFLAAAAKLQVPPERCLVIEDSINGLKAARAAGCVAVGVTNTFSHAQLAAHADHVVDSLTELTPEIVRAWIRARRSRLYQPLASS